ncbi:MAG: fibrobacter succinogenes major paralogous domain-containing protein, partial [Bacteroidota bacterium]
CYGTSTGPTVGNNRALSGFGTGSYTAAISGLSGSTQYYTRAYATNAVGTAYGNEVSFTTSAAAPSFTCGTSTVSDVDNNTYNTVQIGTQCWTQSNLKVSKYRNGNPIPTGLTNTDWQTATSGAYAIYNNDPVNDGLYGKMYNHYAVADSRGLCPTGWHVPSDGEWKVLTKYLDPSADTNTTSSTASTTAGGALKSTATQPTPGGWNSPNTGASNSSGFTALPGGLRVNSGGFSNASTNEYWWSSSVSSGSFAWGRGLYFNNSGINRFTSSRTYGFSVRCCRD